MEDLAFSNLGDIDVTNSRRSAEKESFWRSVLARHRESGLTVRAFCRREKVGEASFFAWRKEITKRDARQPQKPLIPVNVVDSVSNDSGQGDESQGDAFQLGRTTTTSTLLELVMPCGLTLRFDHNIEPERLSVLLSVLEQHARCNGVSRC